MKVEYSEKKQNKSNKRKEKRSPVPFFINLAVIVIGVLLTLSMTIWFNADNFTVSGDSIYSEDEILYNAGVYVGDNMVRMNKGEVAAAICEKLPYIKSAKVKTKIPDTLSITVTPAADFAYLISDEVIYIVDCDYKVLGTSSHTDGGLPIIKGIKADEITVGKTVKFADSEQKETLKNVFNAFAENEIKVTWINVENTIDIKLFVGDKVYVEFGNNANISKKTSHLIKILESAGTNEMVRISFENWTETGRKATLTYEDIRNYKN